MQSLHVRQKRQQGAALLVTMLILTVISLVSFAALRHSGQEANSGARSRNTTKTLYTADAGVQLALSRLTQSPPELSSFDIDLPGGGNLQSRAREQGSPVPIDQVGLGASREGYALNVGAGVQSLSRVYLVNVTATSGGSTAEVEAKLTRTSADATGY